MGSADVIASADETTFSATTDTVTIDTISDGIGILKDGDSTTDAFFAVAGATDVVTVGQVLSSDRNLVAATFSTLGCYLAINRQAAFWYIDGIEVHRVIGTSNLVGAVAMVPGVWMYSQGTATNLDIDYLYGSKGRSSS